MKNVKVVIDNSSLLAELRSVLEPLGLRVDTPEISARIADDDFTETELIILDPVLGETGVANGLIDTLKLRANTSRIPILLCSDESNHDAIISGLGVGATDFILLPASSRSIMNVLNRYLHL